MMGRRVRLVVDDWGTGCGRSCVFVVAVVAAVAVVRRSLISRLYSTNSAASYVVY